MTNLQIIIDEAITNNLYTQEEIETKIKELGFCPVQTFQGWKALGYFVKKGQKAKINTKLWKFTNYKKRALTETEKEKLSMIMEVSDDATTTDKKNHYYMTNAALFDLSQVEKTKN